MLLCPYWIFDYRANAENRILAEFAIICSDFAQILLFIKSS